MKREGRAEVGNTGPMGGRIQVMYCSFLVIASCLAQLLAGRGCLAMKVYSDPHYTFLHNATEAPPRSAAYDYIIVGGGTSGCPLAATLSQNFSVLLLERGGKPYGNPLVENLVGFEGDLALDTDTSASQTFISEDGVPNQRARVLGGGSCLNAGFFTYASPEYVAAAGWEGKLVNESYRWVSQTVAQIPEIQVFQTAARDALLAAGVTPYNGGTYEHVVGTKIGGSIFDSTGHRHTAADLLTYANPDNLVVHLWASAHRLLFNNTQEIGAERVRAGRKPANGTPRAIGVVYRDSEGNDHTALLNDNPASEVIVTAGALGTPQLLMLSGIGPPEHLAAFGIATLVNNTAVGARMRDNPTNSVWVQTTRRVEESLIQVVGLTRFGSYIEVSSGQGQIATGARAMARHLSAAEKLGNMTTAEKLGNRTINAQILMARILQAIASTPQQYRAQAAYGGTFLQKVWGPQSFGELRLVTTNVSANPSVRFNYFQVPDDLNTCARGVRTIMRALNTTAMSSLMYTNETVPEALRPMKAAVESTWPKRDLANATRDTHNLKEFCKDSVTTIWHYHGGCLVGDVVDRDYHVMGVASLRVIDGSTFIRTPGANPQATVMMLGRYMGVQILRDRLGLDAGI